MQEQAASACAPLTTGDIRIQRNVSTMDSLRSPYSSKEDCL